jgi:hypothetical protein
MMLRTTYTYVEMEVSAATYDEIAGKLRAAEYDHAFHDGTIDMHGIGLTKAADPQAASKCKHCGLLKEQHDDPSKFEPEAAKKRT